MLIAKRIFLIILAFAAFIWMAHSCITLNEQAHIWADMAMTDRMFVSQIVYFILKNIPTVIVVIIIKSKWD